MHVPVKEQEAKQGRQQAMSFEEGNMLPVMIVPPPGPESIRMAERLGKVEPPTSSVIARGETPIFWERSRGANIEDADANIYIDLTAGFCVATAGHSNPRIVRAISEQAEKILHSQGGLNPNRRRMQLAEKLAEIARGRLAVSHIACCFLAELLPPSLC
jgi:4-aminobutyrate aminotransferase-like enzyme